MLTVEEQYKIDAILDVLNSGDVTALSSESIEWMALKLRELDKEVDKLYELLENKNG